MASFGGETTSGNVAVSMGAVADHAACDVEIARLRAHVDRLEHLVERVVADERERIRQMAIRNGAVCTGDEGTCCYFADLIGGPS